MQYNGWTNYETWNVKLWLDNEPSTYHWQQELADEHECDVHTIAKALETWHEDQADAILSNPSWMADLLGAAMSDINWHEIATHIAEEFKEELEE